jgi:hypothetical protein
MVMPRSRSMSIESSTCASISRSARPPHLDDAVGQRRLAVVDVGDDREIANVIHSVPIKRKRRARRLRSTPCKSVKKRLILAEKAFAGR